MGETPEALRDLSVSIEHAGRTSQALGQWEEARRAYEEGLTLARSLSAALPNHPEYASLADHFSQHLEHIASKGMDDR
jgi:hypothetical protein